jgi:hypothetical protein
MGMWAVRNELQEKLWAAGIDHGRSIRDILAMRKLVALRLIFLLGPIKYRV